jgi:hypothetical protein
VTATNPAIVETPNDIATVESVPPLAKPDIQAPAPWFDGLSALAKAKVRFVAVEKLKVHPTCDFMPFCSKSAD